jgi:hypothetical protein
VAGSGLALDLTTEKNFLSYMIFFFGWLVYRRAGLLGNYVFSNGTL